jgi:hypothetical protein
MTYVRHAVLLALSISLCAQTTPQLNIVVDEQDRPAAVSDLVVSVGGSEIAVIPGAFSLPADGTSSYLVELRDSLVHRYNLQFSYRNGQLLLDSVSKAGCAAERLNGALSQDSTQLYHLRLTYTKDPSGCSVSPSIALPDRRVKLRFESKPPTATLFFRTPMTFSTSGLPKVLSLEYYSRHSDFTVFFKSSGYLDCPKTISIKQQGDQYVVSDGVHDIPTNGNDDNPPVISCTLTKVQ